MIDPRGARWLFQLHVGLSPLKVHRFRQNVLYTQKYICESAKQ